MGFEALEERTLLSGGSHRLSDLTERVERAHKHRDGDRADVFRIPPQTSTMTSPTAIAAAGGGGTTTQNLTTLTSSAQTADKPQSKVWRYDDKWWGVFPNTTGTYIWRLDGTSWTQMLKLSTATNTKADTLAAGDVTHILLFRGTTSELASVQYVPATGTYEFWSQRPNPQLTTVPLPAGVETATIAMDSTGRMWLASDGYTTISVRHSDSPYASWSAPIELVNNISTDDISVVGALPNGTVGVLWSNQTTDRFGFRLHVDGTDPLVWAADEVPASQSALNVGGGMADDHLNLAIASDSTLYAAVKTSYDTNGFVKVAMLVRRPNGTWDDLHEVDDLGTRPIVVLNEEMDCVTVFYTEADGGGDIVYRESPALSIAFEPRTTLMNGTFNNPSSTKQNLTDELVIVANGSGNVQGVIQTLSGIGNQPPVVYAGPDQTLFGNSTMNVDGSVAGGQPNPPGAMTTTWSKFSGPGTVTFGDASVVDTTATFSAPGTYVLRLTGTDGGLSSHDDVAVVFYDFSLETLAFQDGLFPTTAYSGTRDLRIRSGNPTTNYATNTTLGVDGIPDDAVLLKWDLSAIPQGTSVYSASITINVTGTSTDNYELYELKRNWDEAQATWNIASTGVNWSVPGADGVSAPADRGTVVLGTVGGLSAGLVTFSLNADGLAVLQSWINNPSTNYGFVVQDFINAGDDLGFNSSEISNKTLRPRLNVTYTTSSNEAPVAVADSYGVNEDGTLIVAAPGVLGNDTDGDGDPLTAIKVTDPANGTLSLATNGSFTYTPAGNFNGSDSFTYKANDGTADSNTVTVTIAVNPVNDPPTISDTSDQTIDEDGSTGALAFTVDDVETEAGSLTVSGSSSNTALVPDANIVFGGSGADRTVTITPEPGQTGTATITVTVSDGSTTADDTFLLTVTVPNGPPTISDLADQSIDEDTATAALAFTVGDTETDPDSLSVSGSSSDTTLVPNGNIAFGGSGTDRTVTVTPAANQSGVVTITVTVNDGTATASDTLTFTIVAVNDAPSFTKGPNQTVLQDAGPQSVVGWATAISAGPPNESTQVVTFAASNDNNALFAVQPAVAADGTLTFTPTAGATGSATVTLTLHDDGGTANGGSDTSAPQTFTITVNSANPPTTVSFQEGVGGYLGTTDATIKRSNAVGNYGTTSNLVSYGAGTSDEASLVKWDTSSISTSATVVSASITVYILNGSALPEDYEIYEVLKPWIETDVTWSQPAAGATWDTSGCQGAGDRGTEVLGTVAGAVGETLTITLNAAGVAMVQRWISTPGSNNGIVIQDYDATDWMSLASSEYSTAAKRPKLTITYQ